jgi:hypothetical protein
MLSGQVFFLFEENNRTIGALEYAYLSILVGVVIGQYQSSKNEGPFILSKRHYVLALLLFGSLALSFHWLSRDIWMDEYTMAYRLSGEHFNKYFQTRIQTTTTSTRLFIYLLFDKDIWTQRMVSKIEANTFKYLFSLSLLVLA